MKRAATTAVLAVAFAGLALAHPGHAANDMGAFLAGLLHPLTGLDHLLAIAAAGIWAGLRGGVARWLWPAAFVGMMLVGNLLGAGGVMLTSLEPAIALSVIISGAVIAGAAHIPVYAGTLMLGLFALFHGNAHGLEAPDGQALAFAGGFTVSTLVLLTLGYGAGKTSGLTRSGLARGALSAGIAATGAVLLVS